MTRRTVLVDIDHVISAAWTRDHLIGGEGGWDAYHAVAVEDEPIHDMVALINALAAQGWHIVALTARPAKWRQLTMAWLVKHSICVDEILMRPDDAFHPAPAMKVALAQQRFPDLKNQVAFLLEDREDVVMAFKELGITCLLVHGRRN